MNCRRDHPAFVGMTAIDGLLLCPLSVCAICFFFQAEDGIRDLVRSRGLGDVYKRQALHMAEENLALLPSRASLLTYEVADAFEYLRACLSLIHI